MEIKDSLKELSIASKRPTNQMELEGFIEDL